MNDLLQAALLGLVEGLTEFLPVSSTGHLILAADLLRLHGEKVDVFTIVIQTGAILAVLLLYWPRFIGLLLPAWGRRSQKGRVPASPAHPVGRGFYGLRGLGLLLLTTLPGGLLGLAAQNFVKTLFTPASVALALAVGAALMLLAESWLSRHPGRQSAGPFSLDDMTPRLALGIGCFQCLALWPGFSRSASTIMGAMLLGLRRDLAAEYSFIAAVPLLCGAALFDVLDSLHLFTLADLPFFLTGTALSFAAAILAMKTFIALLGSMTLRPFAFYRLLLAPLVYWFMVR